MFTRKHCQWSGAKLATQLHLLLLAATCLFAPGAYCSQVEQKVSYSGGAGAGDANFVWQIGEREFRLDVQRGAEIRSFVFNGRVFYVCGKLAKTQLDYVAKLKIADASLVSSLSKGACQELSPDFALRFYFSPFVATANVEVGGSFKLNLAVTGPETTIAGSTQVVAESKCVDFSRSYSLANTATAPASEKVLEKVCHAPQIKWRQTMLRELGMTLMRQPGGRQNFQAMNSDLKQMAGLTLSASGQVSGSLANAKTAAWSFKVVTTKASSAAPTVTETSIPAGFQVIDEQSLATLAQAKVPPGTPGSGLSVPDVLRALILGLNPLSGFVPP